MLFKPMLRQDSTVVRAVARKLPECSGCRVALPGVPLPQTVSSGRLFKGSPTGGLAGTASSPPRASAYSSSRLLFSLCRLGFQARSPNQLRTGWEAHAVFRLAPRLIYPRIGRLILSAAFSRRFRFGGKIASAYSQSCSGVSNSRSCTPGSSYSQASVL
jgi:hypothetical protein